MVDRIAPEDSSAGTKLVKLAGTKARVTYDGLLVLDRFETRYSVDGASPDPYDVLCASRQKSHVFVGGVAGGMVPPGTGILP